MPSESPSSFPRHRTRARRRVPLVLGIVAGLLTAALALLWGERTLREFPYARLVLDDETCFFSYAPLQRREMEKPGTPLVDSLWTDARGFRIGPHELQHPDPPPACRVLTLGDSVTYGLWVPAEEVYAARVQDLQRARGVPVRVYNGGVEGQSILQERASALGRWSDVDAAVVTIGRTATDVADLAISLKSGCKVWVPPATHPAEEPPLAGLQLALAVQGFRARIDSLSPRLQTVSGHYWPERDLMDRDLWARARDTYRQLAVDTTRQLTQQGKHVLFVGIGRMVLNRPLNGDSRGEEVPPEPFLAQLDAEIRAAGGEVIELPDVMDVPENTLNPHDWHPSAKGHARIAAAIDEALARLGWLQGCH